MSIVDYGSKVPLDHLYYVSSGGGRGWFAFEDGHYVNNAPFHRATGTDQYREAVRMLGYARETAHGSKIVTVTLFAKPIDDHDERLHAEHLRSAKEKLSVEELKAVRRET